MEFLIVLLGCLKQVVDVKTSEVVNIFVPRKKADDIDPPSSEPPITKMFTSMDGQWLAAVSCFGDIYVFNLETQRFVLSFIFASLTLFPT